MKRKNREKEPKNFNAPPYPATTQPLSTNSFWHPERFTASERAQVEALLSADQSLKQIRDTHNTLMQNQQFEDLQRLNQDVLNMCHNQNLYMQYPFLNGITSAYDFIQRIEDHKRGLETAKGLPKFTLSPSM